MGRLGLPAFLAEKLRQRFEERFWHDDRGHCALALDGQKTQVDSLTSNVGQVLWSGLASPERAHATVESLLSPELWSGFGIRTMSSIERGYNPLGYRGEASRLAASLLEAAEAFDGRLPELFAGFARSETGFPIE